MKNKRQDVDPENLKREVDEPTSPTARVGLFLLCFKYVFNQGIFFLDKAKPMAVFYLRL